ncbi:F-box only protein 32 [Oratosquilla oratoria]|uniref:F-box only protein 32 n=1 Tax=Oratosquilla oratoria TaxID=337810 RepID=UPI003F774436
MMPFLYKDWRGPGEEWVKTEEGWEKKKVVHCGGSSEEEERLDDDDEEVVGPGDIVLARRGSKEIIVAQPHCHITVKCTREIAGFNGLSEALKQLDFRNAVRDRRRFNYICTILDLLITKKLATLTGGAQKMLFAMLEEVAWEVSTSQQNLHVLHHLIKELQSRLQDYLWWGMKLGSNILWTEHEKKLQQITSIATTIQITGPNEDEHPKLQELPEECIREILRRLDNHKDLKSSAEAYSVMAKVIEEQSIWRQLCRFHWTPHQIEYIIRQHKELQVKRDWQKIYHRLRRSCGLREEYAEILLLCLYCHCLFWKSFGHPCILDSNPDFKEKVSEHQRDPSTVYLPVTPKNFLTYFSI